jgi:hypothetical protein
MGKCIFFSTLAVSAALLQAQTAVDLRNQTKNVDFSGAAATRIWKTGTALPSTCNIGESYFLTSPSPELYICTAQNVWNTLAPAAGGSGNGIGSVPANTVPVADGAGAEVASGCTAVAGLMMCPGGFSGGAGPTRIAASEGTAPGAPSITGAQVLFLDSGDHNLKSIDSNNLVKTYATTDGLQNLTGKTLVNPSLGNTAVTVSIANDNATGTTVNMLAKLTGSPSTAMLPSVTDTNSLAGIVVSGGGTSGLAQIAIAGEANCAFDSGTAAGDYVTVSGVTAGACHDAGSLYPTSSQIIGRVLSTNSAAGSYGVQLFGPEIRGGSGTGAGGGPAFDAGDCTSEYYLDD